MNAKGASGIHRPPAVAVSGQAAGPALRPIRLAAATTPAKAKKTGGSLPASATKKNATPTRASPAPKRPPGAMPLAPSVSVASSTNAAAAASVGSTARAKTPTRPATASATVGGGAHGSGSSRATGSATVVTGAAHTTGARGPSSQSGAVALAAAHPVPSPSPVPVSQPAPVAPLTTFSPIAVGAASAAGASATAGSSPSPAHSYAPTTLTTTHRSLLAPSTVATNSVAAATSAVTGERYEPTEYRVNFSLEGDYTCVEAVPQSAALWMGNKHHGGLDIYSCTTGKLTVTLPARNQMEQARALHKARRQSGGPAAATGGRGAGASVSGTTRDRAPEPVFPLSSPASALVGPNASGAEDGGGVVKPTALRASRTHMWVGYANGNVAVYDHLVLTFITEGKFHSRPVITFALLDDGTVVSASEDGTLVHWDTEERNFEAIAQLPSPCLSAPGGGDQTGRQSIKSGVGSQDGDLSSLVALPRSSVVLCGFHSGALYAVDVVVAADRLNATGSDVYRPSTLPLHEGRVNALAVLGDTLFSASEDGTVCATRLQFVVAKTDGGEVHNTRQQVSATYGIAAASQPLPHEPQSQSVTWQLLKRVLTTPCVRGLLADKATLSLYVAYADGLLERWSGNPDDDFGVEEVIREGMRMVCDPAAGDDREGDASTARGSTHLGKKTSPRKKATAAGPQDGAAAALLMGNGGAGNREVTGLVAINAVETLQVLALSSNGINKVWYGHRNLLEEHISTSINALNAVICEDAHDTAVWRERMNILKMKENERKSKYVLILEQLSEQKLMLKFFEKWRRGVIGSSVGKAKEVVVRELAQRSRYRVLATYFGKWANFYDAQQRQFRRHALSNALASATRKAYLLSVFHRWQMNLIQRKVNVASESCADVLARASAALVIAPCYHKWVRFAKTRRLRAEGNEALQQENGLNESQLAQLARKAQRQTLRRALAHWLDLTDQRQRRKMKQETWEQYMDVYARLQDAKKAKRLFQGWHRWAEKRRAYAALAAVAELRARQCQLQRQQAVFLLWGQFVHQKHLEAHAAEMKQIEEKLKKAEAESGSDIFEKLQLQKRIDQLIQQQEKEEWLLRQDQNRLRNLQEGRDATLREREREQQQRTQGLQADGSVSLPVSQDTIASIPASSAQQGNAATAGGPTAASTAAASAAKGPMASHADYFRVLVDQQRLSPAVLAHMPLAEAIYHVMSQLKGNILNMYTDMGLFRQVKDKRRAGTTAVAIFLENFAEVKRLIVSSLRRGTLKAGGRAARWPLSLEALDSIPVHHCASVLNAIKTMVVAYDLVSPENADSIAATCEEVVANADWVFLIARACHMRRKPLLPVNNRV